MEAEWAETFNRIKVGGIVESGPGIVVGFDPSWRHRSLLAGVLHEERYRKRM